MEDCVFGILIDTALNVQPQSRRVQHDDRTILAVIAWAVVHDLPIRWACEPDHWSASWRPPTLPHPSTVSRRSRCRAFGAYVQAVHAKLLEALGPASAYAAVDGKALVVSGASHDRQARSGRGVGGPAKGYKLHLLADADFEGLAVRDIPVRSRDKRLELGLPVWVPTW